MTKQEMRELDVPVCLDDLLPCPFCNAPAYLESEALFGFLWRTYCVRCLRCHGRQGWRDTPQQAITIWNMRHSNPK